MISVTGIDFFALARRHEQQAEKDESEGDAYGAWFNRKEARGYLHTYRCNLETGRCTKHPDDTQPDFAMYL